MAVQVSVSVVNAHCGLNNGSVHAYAQGGLPPYTYLWNTGSTATTLSGLAPADYTVTVTDGLGNTAQATGTVVNEPQLGQPYVYMQRGDCANSCGGIVSWNEGDLMGTAPYTYPDLQFPYIQQSAGAATFLGVCGDVNTPVTVTDAAGCAGSFDVMVYSEWPTAPGISLVTPACGGDSNGSVTINDGWMGSAYFLLTDQFGNSLDTLEFTEGPYTIYGLAAGSYNVMYFDPWNDPYNVPYCTMPALVNVPSLPEPCGSVSGTVFNDVDRDCTQDAPDDLPLRYRVLTVLPGPTYAITDGQGHYAANVPFGSYTLAQPLVEEAQLCPSTVPVPFTVDLSNYNATIDLADSSLAPLDLRVNIWSSPLRPGFPYNLWGIVWNTSAYPSGALSLDLSYDALLGNVLVAPGPTNVSAGAVLWDLAAIPPYGYTTFSANGTVPADISLLGTPITFQAHASNALPELDLTNNDAVFPTTIVGSYDPNDKHAVTDNGNTLAYMLEDDHEVRYTIRFQNTGTASAVNVVVRDTIEEDLDITSLKVLGASHAFTPSIPSGRVLQFTFGHINLPDSGADERLSHGFVSFSLKPRADIAVGDVLTNTAGIYFDLNPPIITNTSVLPVEMSTGVAERNAARVFLQPNPATEELTVTLPGASVANGHLSVLAADGRVVPVAVNARGASAVLDVRALSPGGYILRYADGGQVQVARFVKR